MMKHYGILYINAGISYKNYDRAIKVIEKWEDKAEYQGQFHFGEKNGIGKYIFSDGDYHEGIYKDDMKKNS